MDKFIQMLKEKGHLDKGAVTESVLEQLIAEDEDLEDMFLMECHKIGVELALVKIRDLKGANQ